MLNCDASMWPMCLCECVFSVTKPFHFDNVTSESVKEVYNKSHRSRKSGTMVCNSDGTGIYYIVQ